MTARQIQIATVTGPLPALGQFWEGQGGVRVGEVRGENGQPNYQLILPIDPRATVVGEWGKYGQDVPGAQSIRDGLANTLAMVEAGSPIAQLIIDLEIDGHRDLYLAAPLEYSLCNLNAGEHLDKTRWHWTSTQYSPGRAWKQGFGHGNQYINGKNDEFAWRAVRRVIHSSL